MLTSSGYEVTVALDGNQAVEILDKEEFNLILMDIHLPYKSGLELISYIRKDLKRNTTIIVLSAITDDSTLMQALKLGADNYETKPYDPVMLIENISALLGK